MSDTQHAISNARGWSETINALVAALECDFERLEELRGERAAAVAEDIEEGGGRWDEENGEELKELADAAAGDEPSYPFKDRDEVIERIQESALSVQVRSWCDPGTMRDATPEEFEILLTTGGPALRIMGELDEHCQPTRAWLEYQDWGTPWTEFRGEGAPSQETLLTFCSQFYFGE